MRVLPYVVLGLVLSAVTAAARPRSSKSKKRIATTTEVAREHRKAEQPAKPRGQSFGAPWSGRLERATKFRAPKRTFLRRPHRAFATRTTIEHVRRAILDTLDQTPEAHDLAIGDFSAPRGGWLSEHSSHQSGRDVDLGLFYKRKPAGYPTSFVTADAQTLDVRATWRLIRNLAKTTGDDGGVKMMFLDFDLQGLIYKWAKRAGVSEERLAKVFQYPHGRGAAAGLVRHEPNHDDHLHVRFQCAAADRGCR